MKTFLNYRKTNKMHANKVVQHCNEVKLTRLIRNAHHFSIGDVDSFQSIFKNTLKGNDYSFSGSLGVNVMMPYDIITISYNTENLSYMSLVRRKSDTCIVINTFIKNESHFEEIPVVITVDDIGSESALYYFNHRYPCIGSKEEIEDAIIKSGMTTMVNLFLMLINTKNVIQVEKTRNVRKSKKGKKKSHNPLFEYKTLMFSNTCKKTTVSESDSELNGLTRLHLCRGHFRTYTEDRPLFGHYVGRVWIQPHAKGNKKEGVIHKDYEFKSSINKESK